MSAAETGVYITLIAMMYDRAEPLPYDVPRLARICGVPAVGFKRIVDLLIDQKKITSAGLALFNERVRTELLDRKSKSDSAKKSALLRWEKDKENQQDENATAVRVDENSTATRARGEISDTRSQKSEKNTHTDSVLVDGGVSSPSEKGEPKSTGRGARLPAGWVPTPDLRDWSKGEWPGITDQFIDEQSAMFADYWHALPGAKGRKVDWPATWRNWIRRAVEDRRARLGRPPPSGPRKTMAETGAEVTEFFRQQAEQEDERERAAEGERGNSAHARKLLGGSV